MRPEERIGVSQINCGSVKISGVRNRNSGVCNPDTSAPAETQVQNFALFLPAVPRDPGQMPGHPPPRVAPSSASGVVG